MPQPVPSTVPIRHLNDGRVYIEEITPQFGERKLGTAGILYDPTAHEPGKGFTKRNAEGQDVVVQIDRTCVYGRVTACGLKASRASGVAVSPEQQGGFPLPAGTWVKISGSARQTSYKVSPNEDAYNSWEVQEWFLPNEPRPDWAPEDERARIM